MLCIDLEHRFRPKITRFLLSRPEKECHWDFSCFDFVVDLATRSITIFPRTPAKYSLQLAFDFKKD